jgi:hypothetical protein
MSLKEEIRKLQEQTAFLLAQLKVTDAIVNKLDIKVSSY